MIWGRAKNIRVFSGVDALGKRDYDYFDKYQLEGRKNEARFKRGEKDV